MTEAYYPRIDVPNTQTLQLIVCTPAGCQTESDDMQHEIRVLDHRALSFQQVNRTRDNHDAYGETSDGGNYDGRSGQGRLWALLTGERGEYELAREHVSTARTRLDTMMAFANDGLMIPEQIWDRPESPGPQFRFGEGTGAATPLAWSMAQFIRLAINLTDVAIWRLQLRLQDDI
ncbi:MAG: hypothetical protein ABR501_01585 [Pyrinomonadaceae bacterium]